MGLRQLVAQVEKGLMMAQQQLKEHPTPLAHAYDGMDVHPYQIAASSYLSAAGLTAAAFLSLTVIAALAERADWAPLELLLQTPTLTETA